MKRIPPEAFGDALLNFGMPPWQVEGLIEDYAHSARGKAAEVHPTVREVTAIEARSVEGFARDYTDAFKP